MPSFRVDHSLALVSWVALFAACDPYQRFGQDGDSYGAVDPASFPAANLGVGGNRTRPGGGSFTETPAFAGGQPIGYFSYPVPAMPGSASAPLRFDSTRAPRAYLFDGACQAPPGYQYDPARDETRLDEQGSIFTALPKANYAVGVEPTSTYLPLVTTARVSAAGLPCQRFKSEEDLAGRDLPVDGRHLAWLIIDPAAAVYPIGQSAATHHPGLGLQRWGWYKRYLLAYLDGGELPVADTPVTDGTPPMERVVAQMVPQKLYYPRSSVIAAGAGGVDMTAPGRIGAGYDVLAAKRGAPAYSPLCQVLTYDARMAMPVASLPHDVQTIEANYDTPDAPIKPAPIPFVYCLQVR